MTQPSVLKAKQLQRIADKFITQVKDNPLHFRKQADKNYPKRVRIDETISGFGIEVMKLSKNRAGYNAEMAVIEYIDRHGVIRAAKLPALVLCMLWMMRLRMLASIV